DHVGLPVPSCSPRKQDLVPRSVPPCVRTPAPKSTSPAADSATMACPAGVRARTTRGEESVVRGLTMRRAQVPWPEAAKATLWMSPELSDPYPRVKAHFPVACARGDPAQVQSMHRQPLGTTRNGPGRSANARPPSPASDRYRYQQQEGDGVGPRLAAARRCTR